MNKIDFPQPRADHDLTAGVGRLLHLAEVLDSVVVLDQFSLDAWEVPPNDTQDVSTHHTWQVACNVRRMNREGRVAECGFAGCAVGWATQVPEFIERGLRLHKDPVFSSTPTTQSGAGGWCAVQEFFGVTPACAEQLFSNAHWAGPGISYYDADAADRTVHPTPQEVAARIRAVVAWNAENNPDPGLCHIPTEQLPQWVGVGEDDD